MINHEYLLDSFLNGEFENVEMQRKQLVRILSRSGTLPKVANLQVQYIHSQPEMFLIEPGKQLRLGVRILDKPILALLALRYGIEWQIWYKAISKTSKDYRICDAAAAMVVAKFIDILPEDDRKELLEEFPDDIQPVYDNFEAKNFEAQNLVPEDISELFKFHKLPSPTGDFDAHMLKLVTELALPTETLLMSGGDVRLSVEPTQLLNVYGCRPFPRPEAFTFASSTATSVSNTAFDYAQKEREKLIHHSISLGTNQAYEQHKIDLVNRLKSQLRLGQETAVAISPSGTDISLLFAGICQSVYSNDIVHILVASDETGSGVPLALQGRHFANSTALGLEVSKEEMIDGFRPVELKKIPIRNEEGVLKLQEELDHEVGQAIELALTSGKTPVLHVMDQSKLGYASPSQLFLAELAAKYQSNEVLILVDNSQLRMDVKRIESYISMGFLITLTGSKFYTGPPFSGLLAIPKWFATKMKQRENALPLGLQDYFLKSEFLSDSSLAKPLDAGFNYGSYLRWYAALTEIERFYRVPATLRKLGADMFCEHVEYRIETSLFLESLESKSTSLKKPLPEEARTIFPFFIINKGKVLSHPQSDRLYRLLNQDLSERIQYQNEIEKRIAKQVCHIGQPVKVLYHNQEPSAVLRISLGARALSESWKEKDVSIFFQRIESQMNQVDITVNKIDLILKYAQEFEVIEEA